MESNNDYRQLCKVPRSNCWHAAKHIFALVFFPYSGHFYVTVDNAKFVSFSKLCRRWRCTQCTKNVIEFFVCTFSSVAAPRCCAVVVVVFGSRQRKSGTQRHWKYYSSVWHFVFVRGFSLWRERVQFLGNLFGEATFNQDEFGPVDAFNNFRCIT